MPGWMGATGQDRRAGTQPRLLVAVALVSLVLLLMPAPSRSTPRPRSPTSLTRHSGRCSRSRPHRYLRARGWSLIAERRSPPCSAPRSTSVPSSWCNPGSVEARSSADVVADASAPRRGSSWLARAFACAGGARWAASSLGRPDVPSPGRARVRCWTWQDIAAAARRRCRCSPPSRTTWSWGAGVSAEATVERPGPRDARPCRPADPRAPLEAPILALTRVPGAGPWRGYELRMDIRSGGGPNRHRRWRSSSRISTHDGAPARRGSTRIRHPAGRERLPHAAGPASRLPGGGPLDLAPDRRPRAHAHRTGTSSGPSGWTTSAWSAPPTELPPAGGRRVRGGALTPRPGLEPSPLAPRSR